MEKYNLVKGEPLQKYAELRINEKDIISAENPVDLYSIIIEWVKCITSGDINLTLEDFLICGSLLLLIASEGKHYIVRVAVDPNTRGDSLLTIYYKVNPYSIVHA